MSNATIIGGLVIVLALIVIFQISKVIEYLSILKGEKEAKQRSNNVNAFLLIFFLVGGLYVLYAFHQQAKGRILSISGSVEGETYDTIFWATTLLTAIVFVITHVLLFWFAFKYRYNENRKATYFSHSNKLEIIWTTIPAVTMCVLVAVGIRYWVKVTGDAPEGAAVVEVTGKQYEWIFRYPGKDNKLGKKYFRNINDATNRLGQIWDDKANLDDIITDELHIVVNKPIQLVIGSRDVIHDVGLPHFRQKMDAVPGMPTSMWFTPQYTTAQMREMTKNPEFEYEIACSQMCGKGHYSMKGILIVETQQEYDTWLAKKQSYYSTVNPAIEESPAQPKTANPVIAKK